MKKSHYNIASKLPDGSVVLANVLSGGAIHFSKEDYGWYRTYSSSDRGAPKALVDMLCEGGFLIEDTMDELVFVKAKFNYHKFRTDVLSLTILPTLDCNFDCSYCYENNHASYMSDDTIRAIMNYVAFTLRGKRKLAIAWYGGEPLLALDTIKTLSHFFLEICRKLGVQYEASVVTNGSLLTEETVKDLLDCEIKSAQVTIDGPPRIHNQMRPFANCAAGDTGTFDTIVKNTQVASNNLQVAIRVNVSKDNFEHLQELLEHPEMQKLANRADLYVSPVLPFGAGDKVNHPDFSQSCFDHPGFAKIESSLASTLEQFGFNSAFNFDGSSCNSCRAIGSNHLVIDPDGKLFRCWDSVGDPSEAIGHISAPPAEEPHMKNPKLLQWLNYDPFEQKECRDCKFLPLCMGGCPHRSIADGVDLSMRCAMIKFNYKQVLSRLPEG